MGKSKQKGKVQLSDIHLQDAWVYKMATTQEYANFILEQFGELPGITSRKMMGEYVLYYNDRVFGDICDNRLLVKITEASKKILGDCPEEPPYEGAKNMFLVEDVEDTELLVRLVEAMWPELPERKPKKPRIKKKAE